MYSRKIRRKIKLTEFQLSTFNKVRSLEKQIQDALEPSTFVLNPKVHQLMEELEEVRAHCEHNWVNGICTICGMEEKYQK